MKPSRRWSSIFSNLILLAGLVVIWIAFAPVKVGGQASHVMVNGISMEPNYHTGDLVIVRKAETYQVGDVVTYRDAKMEQYVIHRIIGVEQEEFVLKGDNNSWVDAYHPTRDEIIGKQWIYVPKVGRAMQWLRAPLNLSFTIALLGGILMFGMLKKPAHQRQSKASPLGNPGGTLEGGLYLFGFCALIFLGLGILSFIRPLTRPADNIQYLQESHFSYSATGTPVIYDTNVVRSGEPIFPRLTCFLNIGFNYNVIGGGLQGVSGAYQLVARVADEQSGWQRTIPMDQPSAFNGNTFSTASTLDVCQIVALVNTLEQETGLRANNYTLEIIPQVEMTANANGTQIADSFEPKLVFRFDEVHFFLSTPKGQDDPLSFSQQSSVQSLDTQANTFSILGWEPTVLKIRTIAIFGLVVSMSGLFILGFKAFATAQHSQEAWIQLKYNALLVNVYERDIQPASTMIDVTTIDELAKLAERHNTVILHMTLNFLHFYLVQSNGVTYRFLFSESKRNTPVIEPPRRNLMEYVSDVEPVKIMEAQPADSELIRYVINKSNITHTKTEETIVMGRVKL